MVKNYYRSRIVLKNILLILFFWIIFVHVGGAFPSFQPQARTVEQLLKQFDKGKIPPFSFVYDGKRSNAFIRSWKYKKEKLEADRPNTQFFRFTYTDPKTGMEVSCEVTTFTDFPAVEWTVYFANSADKNSPTIEQAHAVDYAFTYNAHGTPRLHHAKGSHASREDFQPLLSLIEPNQSVYMTPSRGRSSDETGFPFFNIETPDQKGVMVAIGWTGKWYANIGHESEKAVSLTAGMENLALYLMPGERIRTPKVCLLFWEGEDRMVGHNQFRKFILTHHTRRIDGEIPQLPLASFVSRDGPQPCNEHVCATETSVIAEIKRYEQFNILPEVFWLDAGWYPCGGSWWNVGNWTPNKDNFPNGFKPISDAMGQVGSKFLLWFEPERVIKDKPFVTIGDEHPEWITELDGNGNQLYNLGNVDARLALTERISNMIEEADISFYRQDFNFDPSPHWQKTDEEGRKGISEIRHIEGLYAFWDSLLVRFPNLIIDNCSSGGRRIDLETTSRSTPFWRTDYAYGEPIGSQCHTYGLNFYLPLSGTGNFIISPYHARSAMSSNLVVHWDIENPRVKIPDVQRLIAEYKQARPYYYHSDYYPLTGTDGYTGDDVWMAYQMHRQQELDGMIVAFRRPDAIESSINVQLKGLNPSLRYEVLNQDTGERTVHWGKELIAGLTIVLQEAPGSALLFYKEVK